jgi:hypothetical protein
MRGDVVEEDRIAEGGERVRVSLGSGLMATNLSVEGRRPTNRGQLVRKANVG